MTQPLPAPTFDELHAPRSGEVVDFISDLHLSEDTPRGFDAWARYMGSTSADAVIILGDLFEAWVGDDSRHSGFEARCAEVLLAAASTRSVALMVGNRDFLVGSALLTACAVTQLADPAVLVLGDERTLLTHGDALCIDDVEYQQFRSLVRSPSWQTEFLALPLPERRTRARQMREQSTRRQKDRPTHPGFDVDPGGAIAWMRAANTPVLIHGHTHRPASETLAPGRVRHVLSDWELDHAPTPRGEVLRWQRSGITRLPLQQPP